MQNDYCKGCGSKTESAWATTDVWGIVPNINKALNLKLSDGSSPWDLILFT